MSRLDAAAPDHLLRVGSLVAFLLAIAPVGFLLWASDRGFGIGDEGFYLVAAQFPDDIWMAASSSRFYEARIYALSGANIVWMRIFGLVAMLISSSALFFGVWSWLARTRAVAGIASPLAVFTWSVVTVGSLLYYGHFVLTPCYNLLLAIAINIAGGSILLALSRGSREGGGASSACLFAAGLCIGLSFFCKPTSAGLLLALIVGLLAAWPGVGLALRMRWISMLGAGFGCWLLMHFSLIQGARDWWEATRDGSRLLFALDLGYDFRALLKYLWVLGGTITSALVGFYAAYAVLAVGFAGRILLRKRGRETRQMGKVSALLSFAAFGALGIRHGLHAASHGGTAFALFHCALAILFLIAFAAECGEALLASPERRRSVRWLPALLLLTLSAGPLAAWLVALPIPREKFSDTLLLYWWTMQMEALFTAWAMLLLGVTAWAAWKRPAPEGQKPGASRCESLLVIAFLAALPLAGAFGTRNPVNINLIHHLGPALALFLLLLVDVARRLGGSSVLVGGGLLAAAFGCAQIIVAGARDPYDMKPILTNTVATEVGVPPTVLKLDPERSQLIEGLGELARENGFQPGGDILAFYAIPGLVFALGGRSPGVPWFAGDSPLRRPAAEFVLASIPQERLRKAFVLQNTPFTGSVPDLGKFGMRFPDDYVLCGKVESTLLWKPRVEGSN
jgi:hypothetical protein